MKILLLFMVVIMVPGFAKLEDWTNFNSSLLIEVTRPNGVFTCTGVAVSTHTLVTAAHCLEGEVKSVRVFTQDHYDPKQASLAIKDYKINPSYDPKKSRFKADLAKITMVEKFPDFIKIHPIYTGTKIFGNIYRFGFGERNKKNLRTVITPTFRRVDLNNAIIELNDQFSRSGDSGGPIFLQSGSETHVLGIHSTFSHGPEGNYSLNPMLGSYLTWIFSN